MTDNPTYEKEKELEDSYPIYAGFLYVCDGEVQRAMQGMTVAQLKARAHLTSVKNCDIGARELWEYAI